MKAALMAHQDLPSRARRLHFALQTRASFVNAKRPSSFFGHTSMCCSEGGFATRRALSSNNNDLSCPWDVTLGFGSTVQMRPETSVYHFFVCFRKCTSCRIDADLVSLSDVIWQRKTLLLSLSLSLFFLRPQITINSGKIKKRRFFFLECVQKKEKRHKSGRL